MEYNTDSADALDAVAARLTGLLTAREAAERKGVTKDAIHKAIRRGELPAVTLLGRVGLRPADVDAYQPGSYGGILRALKPRGLSPGRPKTK